MAQQTQPRIRTYALDNLRTFLTVLVIFHHAALAYGGTGSFGYRSPYHPPGSSISLTAFNVLNQTYFMGLFFLLSGYFSSIAAKKRSRMMFMKEKTKRLGMPTLIYSLFGKGTIRAIVAWRTTQASSDAILGEFWQGIRSTRGAGGPTWYTASLLAMDALYTISRPTHFSSPKETTERSPLLSEQRATQLGASPSSPSCGQLKTSHVLLALTLTGISSFVIRIFYPFGHTFVPLNLNLGYAPQYILYYCTGIFIQRRGITLEQPCHPRTIALTGVMVAGMNVLGFVKVREVTQKRGTLRDVVKLAGGGFNIFALLYSLLNEFVGFMLAALLLRLSHTPSLSKHWTILGVDLAKGSYAAFLVHIPVLVETMTLFNEEAWKEQSPVLKAAVVGALGTLKSWSLGLALKWVVEWFGWKGYL